jgi:glycosyltransferase involved in cell wall biosynthesis
MSVNKKLIIVSYYWPPSGGIGVHRSLKFAKYLRDFGWEPVVVAPDNAQYAVFDESNFKHVPTDLEVHRVPITEPFEIFKKLSGRKPDESPNPVYVRNRKRSRMDELAIWIRGNLFIPDARALWIGPAVKKISKYIRNEGNVDAIFSDGPPHTNTRIAFHIAKKFSLPWLADFQDPWTQVDYYKLLKISRFADRIHRRMEQDVFRQADKITIASPSWARDLEEIGAKDVDVLYYGYDEDDFSNTGDSSKREKELSFLKDRFVINHAGLLGMDRFPGVFLEVLAEIASENKKFSDQLLLYFPGEVDYSIREYIDKLGLKNNALFPGHISKELAVESMKLSDLLLLPLNKAENVKGRLPGKLYEYLRSYTRVLALGPPDSDVNSILEKTQCGKCLDYDDRIQIKSFLEDLYKNFSEGRIQGNISKEEIGFFDVKNQTSILAEHLNKIIDERK